MSRVIPIAGLSLVCVVGTALWWLSDRNSEEWPGEGLVSGETSSAEVVRSPEGELPVYAERSPFTTDVNNETLLVPANGLSPIGISQLSNHAESEVSTVFNADIQQIGVNAIDDELHERWVEQLRENPALLAQLIDEFRQSTDASRRKRLAFLLGDVSGLSVTQVVGELIYSGDSDSRQLGLSMLRQIQSGNADANVISSNLLSTVTEPRELRAALSSLSTPGAVDVTSREAIAGQVSVLTQHPDPSVRSMSLDILSRWTESSEYTTVLLNALSDSESQVRESAAFALVGHEDTNSQVIDSLLAMAENINEQTIARRGAILALYGMPISDFQKQQLANVERELDTSSR